MRRLLLWALKFFPDKNPPIKDRFWAIREELFEWDPDREELTQEDKMDYEERINRGKAVRKLLQEPAWILIEDLVAWAHKSLIGSISGEENMMRLKATQGKIQGLSMLRTAVWRCVTDEELAKKELQEAYPSGLPKTEKDKSEERA